MLRFMSHAKARRFITCALNSASMPLLTISPALKNWLFVPNPVPGATPRERIASRESSWKYVKSMPKRSLNIPVSKPSSVPSTRSGLRLGLPIWDGVRMLLPRGPATGASVCRAVFSDGCWPEPPYAARSRRLLSHEGRCCWIIGSSLTTYEPLIFGYVTHLTLLPNALLLSTRTAPVRNSRSLYANSCWPYKPSVLFCVQFSNAGGSVPPEGIV